MQERRKHVAMVGVGPYGTGRLGEGIPAFAQCIDLLARDFDGNPRLISEADALIAYLQVLGTMVDFRLYNNRANIR